MSDVKLYKMDVKSLISTLDEVMVGHLKIQRQHRSFL